MADPKDDLGTPPQTDPSQTPPQGAPDIKKDPVGQSQNGTPPAADSGESVTLSKKDYQNLISQRDKNFNQSKTTEDRVAELEAQVGASEKTKYLGGWLENNKSTFADVTIEDLMAAENPDDVEAIAKRVQGRIDKIRQESMQDLTDVGSTPTITPEQKAEKLKAAEKKHDLKGMIDLTMPKSW